MHTVRKIVGSALAGIVATAMLGTAAVAAPAENETIQPIDAAIPASTLPRAAQWQDMKFGMFIHWGVYSTYEGFYRGQKQNVGYPEQIKAWGYSTSADAQRVEDPRWPGNGYWTQGNNNIPRSEYLQAAQVMDAPEFDANRWCQAAKDAGMRYMVFTSKHHDGFTMWNSETTDYSFTKQSPSQRDILAELSTACQAIGIKFGLYFSNIDWEKQPESPWMNNNPLVEEGYMDYMHAQLKEILGGKYGTITELWYDMGQPTPEQSAQMAAWARELQPDIMVNSRVWNDKGDFQVGWDNVLQSEKVLGPWQAAKSIFPECWGYCSWRQQDNIRKSANGLSNKATEEINNLFSTVALGGQFLFNIGPMGSGAFHTFDASVLAEIGKWNRLHPGILTNSRPTYFPTESWGKTMVDDSNIYLGVQQWNDGQDIRLRGAGVNTIKSVLVEGTDIQPEYRVEGNDLVVTLPAKPADDYLPVIRVATDGTPKYLPSSLTTISTSDPVTIDGADLETLKAAKTVKVNRRDKLDGLAEASATISTTRYASDAKIAFNTDGFTDDESTYSVTVGDQVKGGLTVADLAAGVSGFTLEPHKAYRVTLRYDNAAYANEGFGVDATINSVTVQTTFATQTIFQYKDADKLPAEVLNTLPDMKSIPDGETFVAPQPPSIVTTKAGVWRFMGWTTTGDGTDGQPIVSVGSWQFTPLGAEATPSTVKAGQTLTVAGRGFLPGSKVTAVEAVTGASLGEATVDMDGNVSFMYTVPADTQPGTYRVVLTEENSPKSTEAVFTVAPADKADKPETPDTEQSQKDTGKTQKNTKKSAKGKKGQGLASTGATTGSILGLGALVATAGIVATYARKRRS